jgi:2-hydroxy-3-keto-5-methylthiopentenyl-1-phosphate phosphatase
MSFFKSIFHKAKSIAGGAVHETTAIPHEIGEIRKEISPMIKETVKIAKNTGTILEHLTNGLKIATEHEVISIIIIAGMFFYIYK